MELDIKSFATAIITLSIAVIFIVTGLIPAIYDNLPSSDAIHNDDAGTLRFELTDAGSPYEIVITPQGGDFNIINGSDSQTIPADEPSILYADSSTCVWNDEEEVYVSMIYGGMYQTITIDDAPTITRTSSSLVIAFGEKEYDLPIPSWAYLPSSEGNYGFFENGTDVTIADWSKVVSVGMFAGIGCYNSNITGNVPLAMTQEKDGDTLSRVSWTGTGVRNIVTVVPQTVPLNPSIQPITDPFSPSASMQSVVPTYTDGDWGYDTKTENGATYAVIVSYSGSDGENVTLTIPSTVGGYTVKEIGKGTDRDDCVIYEAVFRNIVLPDTLTKINDFAFFDANGLGGHLTIPNGVTEIGLGAFYECSGLTGLTLPDSLTTIGTGAFQGCSGMTGSLILPSHIENIEQYAFAETAFTGTLTIPSTITTINEQSFAAMPYITQLNIPSTVTTIGVGAFTGMSGLTGTLTIPGAELGMAAFGNCGMTKIVIGEGTETIGIGCFAQCQNLNEIVYPSTLTTIDTSAFYTVPKMIGTYSVPDTVTTLNMSALSGMSITSAYLPASVTSVGSTIFTNCSDLWGLVIDLTDDAEIDQTAFLTDEFENTSSITQILNLGDLNITAGSYGLSMDVEISDNVEALGYIAEIDVTPENPNKAVSGVIILIPVIVLAGLILATIGAVIYKKD